MEQVQKLIANGWVSHDITLDGILPTQYTFDMINDWKQAVIGQLIILFVGLIIYITDLRHI